MSTAWGIILHTVAAVIQCPLIKAAASELATNSTLATAIGHFLAVEGAALLADHAKLVAFVKDLPSIVTGLKTTITVIEEVDQQVAAEAAAAPVA